MINISQYDEDILTSCETILRANLATDVATLNAELAGRIVVGAPQDAQLAAREDARLDERQLPQALLGVWCRIVSSDEKLGVGGVSGFGGQSRTVHRLEVLTYALVQVSETGSSVPTTLTTGYKTAQLLARTATLALTANLVGTAGVYNILRAQGSRVPSHLKTITHIHQVRDYFDIYQCTRR